MHRTQTAGDRIFAVQSGGNHFQPKWVRELILKETRSEGCRGVGVISHEIVIHFHSIVFHEFFRIGGKRSEFNWESTFTRSMRKIP